jgi:putative tryptophan/tyrosine transport system substrate-binding protein
MNSKLKTQKLKFVFVASAMLCALGTNAAAEAQPAKKIPRIGYLALVRSPDLDDAFRKGLDEHAYVDGQNIRIEYRFAEGKVERLADLAAELVRLKVDVIVASSTQATDTAKQATKTIPIVFPVTFDPVASGFVSSLARPGGNLTGLSAQNPVLSGKRLELLKEVQPRLSHVAVFWNPTNSGSKIALKETEAAARQLGIRLQVLEIRSVEDLESSFKAVTREKSAALIQIPDNHLTTLRPRIVEFAMKNRLPSIASTSGYAQLGGLMSYGASLIDLYRRAGSYVDRILKGAKPGDLPVEQSTKFEFVINLKAAKQIGLTIPPNVLARADRVIK